MPSVNHPIEQDLECSLVSIAELTAQRNPHTEAVAHSFIEKATKEGNHQLVAKHKAELAAYYSLVHSDNQKALKLLEDALPVFESGTNELQTSLMLRKAGAYAYQLSDYYTAGQYYNRARQILEEKQQRSAEEDIELGDLYYNLAMVYRTEKHTDTKNRLLQKALEIFESHRKLSRVAMVYNIMGNVLLDNEQTYEALGKYLQAVSFFQKSGRPNDIGITYSYNNIGTCYTNLKNYSEALRYLNLSLDLRSRLGSPNEVGVTQMLLGIAHRAMENLTDAEQYFLSASDVFRKASNIFDLSFCAQQLFELYKMQGHAAQALEYLECHLSLQNQLNDEDKRRAIAEALALLKIEQKEQEAQILRQKNEEINLVAKKLQATNTELNQFAHIVSHDLKEPLRMISAYIDLLLKRGHVAENEEARQFTQFITGGATRMNNLINDILEFSRAGGHSKAVPVDLNEVLRTVEMNLHGLVQSKQAVIEIHPMPVVMADRTAMLQLFQNLLSNAIKYNSSHRPVCGVVASKQNQVLELTFYDNGIGIPATERSKVFDLFQRGSRNKDIQGTGIGMAICKKVVEKLNGSISITDNEPSGTRILVTLPASVIVTVV